MSDVPPPPDDSAVPPPPTPPSPSGPASPPPPPPPDLTRPPGYAAYSSNPTPTGGVRRIGAIAKWVVVLTTVVAIGTIVTTMLSLGVSQDATDFLDGKLSDDEFRNAIGPLNAIQLLVGVTTLATGVLTIVWMFRIASNVRTYGRATTWSPLFAIFGWFLPPMVLYIIPFLVLRELWKASGPTPLDGTDEWKRSEENPVLWVWFVLFGLIPTVVLAVQVGSIATGGFPTGDLDSVADSLDDFGAVGIATAAFNVAAAIVWITFVRQLTQRHTTLTSER